MRIAIIHEGPATAHYFPRAGWARALSFIGHEARLVDVNKSPFDLIAEFNPELIMGQSYNMTDAWVRALEEHPHIKLVLRGSDWGSFQDGLDLEKYPILVANDNEKRICEQLKQLGNLKFVHNHYVSHIEQTHNY